MLLRPLLVAAVVAAAAAAQTSVKAAQHDFKVSAKSLVKQHKALLKGDLAAFQPDLDDFIAEVKAGNFGEAVVQNLFDGLQQMQAAVIVDTYDTGLSVGAAAESALDDIGGPGADLGGVYPQGFHNGDGGTFDHSEDAQAKNLAVAYAGLAKKLAKLPLLATDHGAGISVRVLPPQAPTEVKVNESELSDNAELPLTIDVAIGTSDPSVPGDGALWLAGTAGGYLGDVSVRTVDASGFAIEEKTAVVDLATRRWGIKLDIDGAGYAEGNQIVLAQIEGQGTYAIANVGVP